VKKGLNSPILSWNWRNLVEVEGRRVVVVIVVVVVVVIIVAVVHDGNPFTIQDPRQSNFGIQL
jgi:hypothetical protein